MDAQGYIDGIGPMSKGPRFMARLGARVLGTYPLRDSASKMSYYDKSFAGGDATIVATVHTLIPGATLIPDKAPFVMVCLIITV